MRSKIIALLIGGSLAASTIVPALACPYNTQASNEQPQQTAQAQTPSNTQSQ